LPDMEIVDRVDRVIPAIKRALAKPISKPVEDSDLLAFADDLGPKRVSEYLSGIISAMEDGYDAEQAIERTDSAFKANWNGDHCRPSAYAQGSSQVV